MLPKPSALFTLPSLHDGIEVDCRLYFPSFISVGGDRTFRGSAIFAHPYAPLGGSYDDPVVHHIGSILNKQGYVLTTFNFRGAEDSAGKTSWSGKGELGDYVSVYLFMVAFLSYQGIAQRMTANETVAGAPVSLVLGGYSYGSMITAHLPSLSYVQNMYHCADKHATTESDIINRAQDLAQSFLAFCDNHQEGLRHKRLPSSTEGVIMGGSENQPSGKRSSVVSFRKSIDIDRIRRSVERKRHGSEHREVRLEPHNFEVAGQATEQGTNLQIIVSYLLISPLLGAVSGLATMFSRLKFQQRGADVRPDRMTPEEALSSHPSMVLYGSRDTFTSSKKIRKWCEELQQRSHSKLQFREVPEAGHFWKNEESVEQLDLALSHWMTSGQ